MKNKYLKSLVLASVVLGLNYQTQAQDKNEVAQIRSKYNLTKLQEIKGNFERVAKTEKDQAIRIAKQKGWKTKFTTKEGSLVELQRVVNGKPIYYTTFNVAAAKSTRTNHLNSGGSLGLNLMGQGMTAHVWDGGLARTTHQEYDGAGGNNRFSIGDGTTARHFHAAHVAGTIISSGVKANAKGMAPHSKAVGYDWNNDKTEATSAASNGMLISNHSYGYATRNQQGQVQLPQHYFGGYITESRAWDEIMFNAPNYLMVVAAGNDGNDNTANNNPTGGSGFDKLTGHSVSKNNLVVANAQDANVDASGNLVSVSINSSSSEGPTDDFRIKPDITGNGTGVYSTYESSDTAYNSITGTSMASPNVAGSLILLQQHHKNLNSGSFMKAATLKGLALHTADDAGASGPDAVFGWGLLHTKRA
ncbi:S8 family serine peptidase, partial [Tenacibaculum ovolyticum]